jgi:hypothetical protein
MHLLIFVVECGRVDGDCVHVFEDFVHAFTHRACAMDRGGVHTQGRGQTSLDRVR